MKTVIVVTVCALKNGKLLMVQENQEHCRGLWNFPAGHLDYNESIFDAAVREAKEETGFDVKLTGLIGIQNCKNVIDEKVIHIIFFNFAAEIIGGEITFNKDEIMAVDFIDPKKILRMTSKELRNDTVRKDCIERLLSGEILPLDIISNFDKGKK